MAARLLTEALGVRDGDIVAFTGGGGKTTAMFRLARELAGAAGPVVTTTTRILVPPPADDLVLVVAEERDALVAATRTALASGRVPVVGRATTADGKLAGVPPAWCAELAALGATCVLVEADGAARLPITAPRAGEPVIPECATLVVAVVGVDALEGPVSAVAHRPERVVELTGVPRDARLDAAAVALVLVGPDGNTRGAPQGARVVALVNKADDDARLRVAREIARAIRARRTVRVVLAALEDDAAVREVVAS